MKGRLASEVDDGESSCGLVPPESKERRDDVDTELIPKISKGEQQFVYRVAPEKSDNYDEDGGEDDDDDLEVDCRRPGSRKWWWLRRRRRRRWR